MTTLQPQISTAGFITGSWIPAYPTTPLRVVQWCWMRPLNPCLLVCSVPNAWLFLMGYSMRQRRAHRHEDATMLELFCRFFSSRANCICADNTTEVWNLALLKKMTRHHQPSWRLQGQKDIRSKLTFFKSNRFPTTTHAGAGYSLSLLGLYCTLHAWTQQHNNLLLLLTRERDLQGTE